MKLSLWPSTSNHHCSETTAQFYLKDDNDLDNEKNNLVIGSNLSQVDSPTEFLEELIKRLDSASTCSASLYVETDSMGNWGANDTIAAHLQLRQAPLKEHYRGIHHTGSSKLYHRYIYYELHIFVMHITLFLPIILHVFHVI